MSWYFLGGFSAYLSVPSGRRLNHSGCSFSHGWSGEHWIAKSSAISIAEPLAAATSALELAERAELGVDRVVPALLGADRPRAARIVRPGLERVVLALPVRAADRMHRRQVDDVEAELGELRQHLRDAGETAPRAREELVPGAEARELAVDVDLVASASTSPRSGRPRRGERLLDGQRLAPEQDRALRELARQVLLARLDLALDLVLLRRDAVDPRLDAELPAAAGVGDERAGPAVVADGCIGASCQRLALAPCSGRRRRALVAVSKDRRGDFDASPCVRLTG